MQVQLKAPTATKNFSYWRALVVASAVFSMGLAGCDTLRTRSEVDEAHHADTTHHQGSPAQTAPPIQSSLPVTPPPAPAAPAQPAAPAPPTFLNKELPKVGLILGPGGMKTYAEIGVLHEFAKARIPIHAIVGLEWGAVIGGLYSMQGQANEAEWKAFKLRDQDIPSENGFLSSTIAPLSIATLNPFLDTVFGSAEIEKSHIEFACPAYWSHVDRFGWMNKGPLRDAMRACVPYPPIYQPNEGVTASPFAVEEAAQYLRSKGANLIVLVNVLGAGDLLPSKAASHQPSDQLLWSEIRREMLRMKAPYAHFTINVNTTAHPITDMAGHRALMEAGAKASADVINKMVSQYGF